MSECTKNVCKFRLVKFKLPLTDMKSDVPQGADPLNTDTIKATLEEAAKDAAKPDHTKNVAANSKCDEDCYCVAVGEPQWEKDEHGAERYHDSSITHEHVFNGFKYTLTAKGQACDGVQDGVCRPRKRDPDYKLAMAGEIPGLGLTLTIANPELITDAVLAKFGELEELG